MEKLTAAITDVRTLATADGSYPILSAWMASPSGASPEEQFELSLTFLLDGIAARLPKHPMCEDLLAGVDNHLVCRMPECEQGGPE
jgi:hypothetical protein